MNNRNPRIAMLGQFPPSLGGICTNIQNIIGSPLKNKYNFLPFQTGSSKYGTSNYFDEKFYSKFYRFTARLFNYMIFLLRYSPNIVHINTSFGQYSFCRDSLYMLVTKFFRKKIILQIHGGILDEFCQKNPLLLRKFVKRILEIPKQILVSSSFQQRPFGQLHIKQRIKVIPNMIDVNKFDGNDSSQNNFDIPSDSIVILFVAAHFFKEKGVWEILNAIPLVTKKCKKTIFSLVGVGKEETRMKVFCKDKGLQDYVRFTSHLNARDLIKLFRASDIFILPSYSEGFPLTILEAMAAGLPIISTPVGAIPEIIEEGVNGFLVQPRDPQSLGKKIVQLIEDKGLRAEMSKNNLARVREKYDLKAVAKIFEGVYSELLSAK